MNKLKRLSKLDLSNFLPSFEHTSAKKSAERKVEKKEIYGVVKSFFRRESENKSFCVKRSKIVFYYLDFFQRRYVRGCGVEM